MLEIMALVSFLCSFRVLLGSPFHCIAFTKFFYKWYQCG